MDAGPCHRVNYCFYSSWVDHSLVLTLHELICTAMLVTLIHPPTMLFYLELLVYTYSFMNLPANTQSLLNLIDTKIKFIRVH
jgi:hypothetical protein